MPRKQGAKNVQSIEVRKEIATISTKEVLHLVKQAEATPREQFKALIRHQRNFLNWIDSRHNELIEFKSQAAGGLRGPKDAVYRKYRWYVQQQTLLESINAFEVFYKTTLINLGIAIHRFVSAERIKGDIDVRALWSASEITHPSVLMFQHKIFHNLDTVNEITNMLISAKRYQFNQNDKRYSTVRAIHTIFQIRHTLSHNQGLVTQSDAVKFNNFGYHASVNEVIDPNKDHLGSAIRDLMLNECNEFTDWVLQKTKDFLSTRIREGVPVVDHDINTIQRLLGGYSGLSSLSNK